MIRIYNGQNSLIKVFDHGDVFETARFFKTDYCCPSSYTGAEIFYLIVWGMVLFPQGPFLSKLVWTLTCAIAMGSVIAVLTIALVVGRLHGRTAFFACACILFLIGTGCAFLCSRIDAVMNYFGGPENTQLFFMSGIIPSVIGGLVYGWLLYSDTGQSVMARYIL